MQGRGGNALPPAEAEQDRRREDHHPESHRRPEKGTREVHLPTARRLRHGRPRLNGRGTGN